MKHGFTTILRNHAKCQNSGKPGESTPKRPKRQQSTGKIMANAIWDAHGVIFIDYLEKERTITGAYYSALLDRLIDQIRKKRPHLKKQKYFFHRILETWSPATIIYSKTSSDGCVVGVLSRTNKLNGKQKSILEALTNRIIWKA